MKTPSRSNKEKEVYLYIPSPNALASPFRIPPSSERIPPKTPKTPIKPNVFYYQGESSDEEENGEIDTYGSFFPSFHREKLKENNVQVIRVDEAAEKLREWDERRNQEAKQFSRTIDDELSRRMEEVRIDVMVDYLQYSKDKKKERSFDSHQTSIQKAMDSIKSAQLKEYEEKRKQFEQIEKEEAEKVRIKEEKEKEMQQERQRKEAEAKAKADILQKQKDEEDRLEKEKEEEKKKPQSISTISSINLPNTQNLNSEYLSALATEEYTRRVNLARSMIEEAKVAESDPTRKKQIFPKVNVPVSQISNTLEQVQKKSQQLLELLNSLKSDRVGLVYSQHLLFTKIIEQASTQVSAHLNSCFGFGAVLSYLVSWNPDILEHLLGYFHFSCPYTFPNYVRKTEEMSEVDHKDALGYKKRALDGAYETEENYVKRMEGIISVYAAFMSCNDVIRVKSNYGIDNCWIWMARLLNMPPQKITSDLLTSFIKVCGHQMQRRFGKQFNKIMNAIYKDLLPKLVKSASTTRLELLCQDFEKTGQMKPMEGWDLR